MEGDDKMLLRTFSTRFGGKADGRALSTVVGRLSDSSRFDMTLSGRIPKLGAVVLVDPISEADVKLPPSKISCRISSRASDREGDGGSLGEASNASPDTRFWMSSFSNPALLGTVVVIVPREVDEIGINSRLDAIPANKSRRLVVRISDERLVCESVDEGFSPNPNPDITPSTISSNGLTLEVDCDIAEESVLPATKPDSNSLTRFCLAVIEV